MTEWIALAEHLAWPVVALVLGFTYKKPVTDVLKRLKRGRLGGAEVEMDSQKQLQAAASDSKALVAGGKEPPDLTGAGRSPTQQQAFLAGAALERHQHAIYGEQLALLRALQQDATGLASPEVEAFYSRSAARFDPGDAPSFGDWTGYLTMTGFVDVRDGRWYLSNVGVALLHLVDTYPLRMPRAG